MTTLQSQINILAAVNCGVDQRLSTLEQKMLEVQYDRTKTIIKNEENNSDTVIDYLGYNAYDAMVVMKNEEGSSDFFEREYNLIGNDGEYLKLDDENGKKIIDLALNPYTLKLLELQYVTIENDIAKWEFSHKFDSDSIVIELDETDYNIDVPIYTDDRCVSEANVDEHLSKEALINEKQKYYMEYNGGYKHVDVEHNLKDITLDSIYVIVFEKDDSGSGCYFNSGDYYITGNAGTTTGDSYSIKNIEHISYRNLKTDNNKAYYIKHDTSLINNFTETLIITTPVINNTYKLINNTYELINKYELTKCETVNDSLILYYHDNNANENSTIIKADNKQILRLNRYFDRDNITTDDEQTAAKDPYKYYNLFEINDDPNISFPSVLYYRSEDNYRIYKTIDDPLESNEFPKLDRIHLYSDKSGATICSKYKNITIINNMKPEILKYNQDIN